MRSRGVVLGSPLAFAAIAGALSAMIGLLPGLQREALAAAPSVSVKRHVVADTTVAQAAAPAPAAAPSTQPHAPPPTAPPPGAAPATPGAPPSPWAPPAPGATPGMPVPHPGYSDMASASVQGTQDAEADVNGALWFLIGCLGLLGILVAYVVEPSPPPARLMGKSPEYVIAYTTAYKSAGKSAQAKQAIFGCLVGTAVSVVIWLIVFGLIASEANMTPQ